MFNRVSWLSLTPEPERELPVVVAILSTGGRPDASRVDGERHRIERLVLHGSEGEWLAYLTEVRELIERAGASADEDVIAARSRAATVLANHHNLLLGIPGAGAMRTAGERARMNEIIAALPTQH